MKFEFVLDEFEQFIGVNPITMIFAWINLIILYFILKKLALSALRE